MNQNDALPLVEALREMTTANDIAWVPGKHAFTQAMDRLKAIAERASRALAEYERRRGEGVATMVCVDCGHEAHPAVCPSGGRKYQCTCPVTVSGTVQT